MAMIITWQVLNALTYPKRNKDFSAPSSSSRRA